jgi:hypothetical protein
MKRDMDALAITLPKFEDEKGSAIRTNIPVWI